MCAAGNVSRAAQDGHDERRHQPCDPAGHRSGVLFDPQSQFPPADSGRGSHGRAHGNACRTAHVHAAAPGRCSDRAGVSRTVQHRHHPHCPLCRRRTPRHRCGAAGRAGLCAIRPAGHPRHGYRTAGPVCNERRRAGECRLHYALLQGTEDRHVRRRPGGHAGFRSGSYSLWTDDLRFNHGGGCVRRRGIDPCRGHDGGAVCGSVPAHRPTP